MANIYQKKGTRFLWCWGFDASGARWDESTKQTDPKAAKLAARDLERRYTADPDWKTRSKLTLVFAMSLVRDYQRASKKAANTVRATEYHARHLIEILGADTPLASITLDDTTSYLAKRVKQGASRHTVAKELTALTQAMRRAEKRGLYRPAHSPVHYIPDELGKVYKPRDRWLPRSEYAQLMTALTPNTPTRDQRVPKASRQRAEREDRRDYVAAWVHLGARKTELFDVLPGDYDDERRELRVRGTKTEGAGRLISVNVEIAPVLRRRCDPSRYTAAHLARLTQLVEKKSTEDGLTKAESLELGRLDKPFRAWTDGSCTRDLAVACKRAGIAPVTPNDLRRTFCSWMCQAGVPERLCAEMMGHEDTTMVRAVYGHFDRQGQASAVAKLVAPLVLVSTAAPTTEITKHASDASK